MRQETSGLYAVAVRPAGVGAGAVRHAYEIQRGVLLTRRWRFGGPRCAADEQEAQARNHRQDTRRHGAASAVELGRSLGAHAVRTRAEHTRTLGRPPLGWSHRIDPMPSKLCAGAPISSRSDGTCELKEIAARGGVANCQAWRSVPSEGAAQWSPRRGMMMRWWVSAASLRTGPAFLGVVAVVGPRSIPRALSRPPSPRPGRRCTTARARAGESTSATGWPIRLVVPATRSRGARACRGRPHARCACPARLLARRLACSDSAKRRPPSPGGEPALAGGSIARGGAIFADSSSRGGRRT